MKKLLALILALPTVCFGLANDMILMQRNAVDTGNITRIVPWTAVDSLFWFDGTAVQPKLVTLGSGLSIVSGVLDTTSAAPSWASITGKPPFATVATTGAYADLSGAPTIPSVPSVVSAFTNDAAYINQAGARTAVSLTVTGSGAASYNNSTGVLNVPTPAAATTPSQSSASRTLNTAFQVSTTRPALVVYSTQMTVTASISGGQDGDVILEIASDAGFTLNVQTLSKMTSSQTYTLAIALQGVQKMTAPLTGWVPAGFYARIRTVSNTGSPAFAYQNGQEVLF